MLALASMLFSSSKSLEMKRGIVRGAFGEVRLAFRKDSCEKVAVKIIEKKSFTATTTTGAVSFFQMTFVFRLKGCFFSPQINLPLMLTGD